MKEVLTLSTQCLQPDHCGLLASCVLKKIFWVLWLNTYKQSPACLKQGQHVWRGEQGGRRADKSERKIGHQNKRGPPCDSKGVSLYSEGDGKPAVGFAQRSYLNWILLEQILYLLCWTQIGKEQKRQQGDQEGSHWKPEDKTWWWLKVC